MEKKLDKIYKLVIVLIVLVSIELIITVGSKITVKESNTTTNENTTQETKTEETKNDYDVSMMEALTVESLVNLFNNKNETYVVYLGRSTCSACVRFLPTLQKMQDKYKYVTRYLDITTVDTKSEAFQELDKKLSKKVTLTVNGTTETKEFKEYYGYTPMTFIIEKGKFKDGIVGAYSEEKFESFLNTNGIK